MMKKIKTWGMMLLAMVGFAACTDDFDDPEAFTPVTMTPTMTISDFKALYKGTPISFADADNIVISGKVTSSDRYGNFYKSMWIVDETGGLEVKIGKSGYYNFYHRGQTIYIKAAGLTLGSYGNVPVLGTASMNPSYETAYIDHDYLIKQCIFEGDTAAPESAVEVESLAGLSTDMVGKLVKIKNLTWQGAANSYPANVTSWAVQEDMLEGTEASNVSQYFDDAAGKELCVRTSGYARFASEMIPTGKVNLTGVYTLYKTYAQLVLISVEGIEEVTE